ncbi:MAG: aspartate aminotransferase family protein [Phycisphaeraceae bacterium]|nr:aspartate aminotransferase family protein [Phycisphaeraceae bacterium]
MLKPIGAQKILEKKAKFLIPCAYHFYKDPPQMVRGQGMYLTDAQGKDYMDLYAGVSVHALGHCHPELTDVICEQIRTLQHSTTIYLTEPIVNLAEALADFLPGDLCRTFFCCSGSEANEGAALLATLFTGRSEFLAFQNGLHGRTKLGMSLTGLSFWRTDPMPVGGITHVPAPHCIQCPVGREQGLCAFECVDAVEQAILTATSGKPAAMFVEPIQGNGGIVVPPEGYYSRLRSVLNRYDMLLIADEVQTGFGRTGRPFGLDHWDVVPDILTGGKALGGGTPVGFFSTTDRIAQSYTRPGASTFGGNPVTAMAALKFLQILKREGLAEASAKIGVLLKERLQGIMAKNSVIADIRGKGLMIGVEIRALGKYTAPELTDHLLEQMKEAGYLVGKTGPGRNVVTFMPPLIIKQDQALEAMDAFEGLFEKLA